MQFQNNKSEMIEIAQISQRNRFPLESVAIWFEKTNEENIFYFLTANKGSLLCPGFQ